MGDILTLAGMIGRSWVRSRAYLGSVAAGVVLLLSALALNELSGGQEIRVLTSLGLFFVGTVTSVSISWLVLVDFSGGTANGALLTVVARPISRASHVLSRALVGYLAILASNLVLGLLLALLVMASGGGWTPNILVAAGYQSIEGFIMVSLSLFLASGSSVAVSLGISAMFYLAGSLAGALGAGAGLQSLARLVPRFSDYDLSGWVQGLDPLPTLQTTVVGIAWVSLFLAAAVIRFEKEDLR